MFGHPALPIRANSDVPLWAAVNVRNESKAGTSCLAERTFAYRCRPAAGIDRHGALFGPERLSCKTRRASLGVVLNRPRYQALNEANSE
jgi:hypothetical protein